MRKKAFMRTNRIRSELTRTLAALIIGAGAVARPDGGAILALAAQLASHTGMIGPAGTLAEGGWNGFNVLHTAASRVGALDLGFLPQTGGRDFRGILDGTANADIDLVYLLGADEFDTSRLGRAFVLQGGARLHGQAERTVARPGHRRRRNAFPPGVQLREDPVRRSDLLTGVSHALDRARRKSDIHPHQSDKQK